MSKLDYLPQFNGDYFNSFNNLSSEEIKDAIKISLMMVKDFRDILDELSFDEEKLRELQFNLDDNYEIVEKIYKKTTQKDIKELLDKLLIQMAKLEMEIGDLILEQKHKLAS